MGEYDDFKPNDDLGHSSGGDDLASAYPGSLGNLDQLGYAEDYGTLGLGYPGDLGPAYPGGWRDEPSMAGEAFGWKWLQSEWKDMRSWWKRLLNLPGPAAVPASTHVQAAPATPHGEMGWEWPWHRWATKRAEDRREWWERRPAPPRPHAPRPEAPEGHYTPAPPASTDPYAALDAYGYRITHGGTG